MDLLGPTNQAESKRKGNYIFGFKYNSIKVVLLLLCKNENLWTLSNKNAHKYK